MSGRVRTCPFSATERAFLLDFMKLGNTPTTLSQLVALPSIGSCGGNPRHTIKRVHNLIERVNQKAACISSRIAEYDGFGQQTAPHRWVCHHDRAAAGLNVEKPKHRHAPLATLIRATLETYGDVPLSVYDLAEEVGRTGRFGPSRTDCIAVAAACRRAGIIGDRVGIPGGGSEMRFNKQSTYPDIRP